MSGKCRQPPARKAANFDGISAPPSSAGQAAFDSHDPGDVLRTRSHSSLPNALSATELAHRFAGRWALRNVTLAVTRGEVLAIRGSNGSGKSTFLRIVASALRPSRGECLVFGHSVLGDPRAVRSLAGLLGHSPALYRDLTVTENLRFAARMACIADDPSSIAAAIATVGLSRAANERARDLSSGMQRRVAIARLAMRAPALLLLDEPHNSLDDDGVELVNQLVRATRDTGGATVIVTHDLDRLVGLADRIATMDDGHLSMSEAASAPQPIAVIPRTALRVVREGAR